MGWYRLTLSRAQLAAGETVQRREAFVAAFVAARGPRTMALFQQEREDGGLDLFLTPGCGEHATPLLESWGCLCCQRPSMIGLQLAAGHHEMACYVP